jgi:phosphatidate cytidylyltransferase
MSSELTKRVAVAAIGIPVALVAIYAGGWALGVLLAVIAAMASLELFRMARNNGVRAFVVPGVILAVAPVLLATGLEPSTSAAAWSWYAFVAMALLVSALAIFRRGPAGAPLAAIAATVFGGLFTGGTLAFAVFLRRMDVLVADQAAARWVGAGMLLFPLVLTWVSDTAAYAGGRLMGRRRLIPSVSPAKTVEGALAGVAGTVIAGAVYAHMVLDSWFGLPVGLLAGAAIGLVVSPVAQLGDLAESVLKRAAGVKDSGTVLPGHGGVLDRFDSLFFAIPVTYWLLLVMLQRGGAA